MRRAEKEPLCHQGMTLLGYHQFHPSWEHFSWWGSDAQRLLNHLATISKLVNMTDNNLDTFKCFWRTHISVALQQCNARVLMQKMTRTEHYISACDSVSSFTLVA